MSILQISSYNAEQPLVDYLTLFVDSIDGQLKIKDYYGQIALVSDYVSGGGGTGGNLIDVASGVINFVGGVNGQDIVVQTTDTNNFTFQSTDSTNAFQVYGDSGDDFVRVGFLANRLGEGGGTYFNFGNSDYIYFDTTATPSGFLQFDTTNLWTNLVYKLLIGSDNEQNPTGMLDVITSDSAVSNLRLVGNPLLTGSIDVNLDMIPLTSSGIGSSYINIYGSQYLYIKGTTTGAIARFEQATANVWFSRKVIVGQTATSITPSGVIEAVNNVTSTKNLRLISYSPVSIDINTTLEFAPQNAGANFINYVSGQLHFSFNGTEVARFGANTTANYIVYNNMSIGYGTGGIAPSSASLEIYQDGNTNVNLKLTGKTTGSNATLFFNPFSGSDAFINVLTGSKLYFQVNNSGTSYFSSTLWNFALPVSVVPALSTSSSALTITPTYSGSGNNGLSITGSSSQATTRGISITSSYTGATSNAFYIGSSITASGGLAVSGLITPTLVASANGDILVAKDINPTFTNSAFTGLYNISLRVQTGAVAFATTSGFVTIGTPSIRTSTSAKFSISQTGSALGFTSAQLIDVADANYGIQVNNPVVNGLSGLPKYGVYSNVAHGNQDSTRIPYGFYGKSSGGYGGYGGYFEYGNGASGLQTSSYYGIYATITGFNSAASTNSKVYSGYFSMINNIGSGGTGMTYGIAINQVAQTGTAQWKYFECQLTGTSEFYIGSQTTYSNGRQIWSSIGMLLTTTASTDINASALLQLDSTTKGFLPPRMTGAQAVAISSPATGLMVYATSTSGAITSIGWWGYNGSTWVQLG